MAAPACRLAWAGAERQLQQQQQQLPSLLACSVRHCQQQHQRRRAPCSAWAWVNVAAPAAADSSLCVQMLLLLHQYPLALPYQTHARAVLLALPLHPLLLQSLPWLLLLALCVATAA